MAYQYAGAQSFEEDYRMAQGEGGELEGERMVTASRTRAPRRRRIWTSDQSIITVGTAGQAGQIVRQIDGVFLTSTGLASAFGCTVARTHVCYLIDSSTNTSVSFIKGFLGIGIFPEGMDNADFPDLASYEGNYYAYECFNFQMPGASSSLVLPAEAAFGRLDYRSMRKIARTGERVVLVLQLDTTEIVRFRLNISILMLLP